MKIIEISKFYSVEGAYSTVLIDYNRKVVLKLFKSYDHPDLNGTDKEKYGKEKIDSFRKEVFKSEVEAYSHVQNSEILKEFTPAFLGTIKFDRVLYCQRDITNQYLTDCCIKIEFIEGKDYKILELLEEFEQKFDLNLDDLIKEFKKNEILYLDDASIIINDTFFKIIDFGAYKVGYYPNIDKKI